MMKPLKCPMWGVAPPGTRLQWVGLLAIMVIMMAVSPAQAVILPPGAVSTPPDTIPPDPAIAGPTLASIIGAPFVTSTGLVVGTYSTAVIADAGNPFGAGLLTFVYSITNTTPAGGDSVARATAINFTGFLTDVGFVLGGGTDVSSVDRSATGSTVGFDFAGAGIPAGGGSSDTFWVRTNASAFEPGFLNIIDGGVATVAAFQPAVVIPEPATMTMLGTSLAFFGGWYVRRRSRK